MTTRTSRPLVRLCTGFTLLALGAIAIRRSWSLGLTLIAAGWVTIVLGLFALTATPADERR